MRSRLIWVVLVLTGAACSSNGGASVSDHDRAALLGRPTLEAEVARLDGVRTAVRDALSGELGLSRWSDLGNETEAGCDDFDDPAAQTRFLSTLVLAGGVPDARWPEAVGVVTRLAGASGFGAAETVVDKPGEHEVVLRGERGSLLRFGTTKNATLALETGCHLPAAAHAGRS